MLCTFSWIVTEVRVEIPLNIPSLTAVSAEGSVIEVIAVPWNACFPIVVIVSGRLLMVVRLVFPVNAISPMLVILILSSKVIEVRTLALAFTLRNAWLPIDRTLEPILKLVIAASRNAPSPITVRPSGRARVDPLNALNAYGPI